MIMIFISGSRFLKFKKNMKYGYPLERMIPNFFISSFERLILKIPLSDFHQGFKIYSKKFSKKWILRICQMISYLILRLYC